MNGVSALWPAWRDGLLAAVEAGEATPAAVANALGTSEDSTSAAWDHVDAALEAGGRRRCQNCRGKGTIPTPHTGADQTCVVCEGKGSVAKR